MRPRHTLVTTSVHTYLEGQLVVMSECDTSMFWSRVRGSERPFPEEIHPALRFLKDDCVLTISCSLCFGFLFFCYITAPPWRRLPLFTTVVSQSTDMKVGAAAC